MKRTLSLVLTLVLALACANFAMAQGDTVAITYFPGNAMAGSGELTGWNGKFFADHGLTIEVMPFSAEKLQAMLASGDMADVMWLPQQELKLAMEAGMLLNLDDHLSSMENVQDHIELFEPFFNYARNYNSNNTGTIYYITTVGAPGAAVAADTDRYAIKMNWAAYRDAEYPTFSTLEDSIPVFQKMKEVYPVNAEGLPTYAIHMFSDFDTAYFFNMESIYNILGKSPLFLAYGVEYDVRDFSGYSIFQEGSTYYRGLKFLYEMNQAGLIDPDSMAQTRSTASGKIKSGAALAGWAANPGWEADGYYPVLFDEFVPNYRLIGSFDIGGYCISANCKDPEAAIKFLDLLANDDNIMQLRNGPKGIVWDINDDGEPYFTEKFFELSASGESQVDEDGNVYEFWNNGYLLSNGYVSSKYGTSIGYSNWPSMYEYQYSSDLALDWADHYGYPYLKPMLEDKEWPQAILTEGFGSFLTSDDDDMVMTKAALMDTIVPASWQMVFAKDEAQFESIWADMKQKCESLGIDDVIQYKLDDIAQARAVWASLSE